MIQLSEQQYWEYKSDVPYWKVAINTVLDRHAQRKTNKSYILAFPLGQNPVFWVDGTLVVKFFCEGFGGEKAYENEVECLELIKQIEESDSSIPLALPVIIAHGHLYNEDDPWLNGDQERRWHWPYIIQTFIRGRPIQELLPKMAFEQKIIMAKYLGQAMYKIHSVDLTKLQSMNTKQEYWRRFSKLIERNFKSLESDEEFQGLFSADMIKRFREFLPKNFKQIFYDAVNDPCLLHADMNAENLLGTITNGEWKPVGIIDFGDSFIGDRIYELIPIHIDIFKCDKNLTFQFMQSYGIENFQKKNFSEKAMWYTILHRQDPFRSVFEVHPEFRNLSLDELFQSLWDFSEFWNKDLVASAKN